MHTNSYFKCNNWLYKNIIIDESCIIANDQVGHIAIIMFFPVINKSALYKKLVYLVFQRQKYKYA